MSIDGHVKLVNRAINWGLGFNIVLALAKTIIGLTSSSEALFADGMNSASDVVYYLVVKALVRFAHRPADREHPYGHRQLETIAALAVGAFVATTAVVVFWMSVNRLYRVWILAERDHVGLEALGVALATLAAKLGLTGYTWRVARRTENPALLALALDHRNDVLTAAGATFGILWTHRGHTWADPLVGCAVATVVLLTGIEIMRESSTDLMDTVPSEALDRQARDLLGGLPGIRSVEEVHAHRFGPYFILNVAIGVDGSATVTVGDRIATEVERRLCSGIPLVQRVYVHYHPAQQESGG